MTHHFDLFDFVAGGIAGCIAKTITAPVQRVKLLLQTQLQNSKLKSKYNGMIDCFSRCVRQQGVWSLWRGNMANIYRYFPTQAINFSAKDFFARYFDIQSRKQRKGQFLMYNILCGGLAGSTSTLFVHPLDFARTRIGVDLGKSLNEREFKGLTDCITKVYKTDGIRGIYSGFVIAFYSMFIYRGLYFGIYDFGKKILLKQDKSLLIRILWAQAAVLIAQQIAYPGDTLKRKMFMQASRKEKQYSGSIDCIIKVYKNEGIRGFWRGAYSNIIRGVGSSLCLILYDEIKKYCGKKI